MSDMHSNRMSADASVKVSDLFGGSRFQTRSCTATRRLITSRYGPGRCERDSLPVSLSDGRCWHAAVGCSSALESHIRCVCFVRPLPVQNDRSPQSDRLKLYEYISTALLRFSPFSSRRKSPQPPPLSAAHLLPLIFLPYPAPYFPPRYRIIVIVVTTAMSSVNHLTGKTSSSSSRDMVRDLVFFFSRTRVLFPFSTRHSREYHGSPWSVNEMMNNGGGRWTNVFRLPSTHKRALSSAYFGPSTRRGIGRFLKQLQQK